VFYTLIEDMQASIAKRFVRKVKTETTKPATSATLPS
jgi:hypothetical protein